MRLFSRFRPLHGWALPPLFVWLALLLGAVAVAVALPARAQEIERSVAPAPAPASTAEDQPAAGAPRSGVRLAPKRMPVRDRNAKARVGLIVGGSILFGVSYGLPCAGPHGVWCVPFAGPFLAIAQRRKEDNRSTDEDGIVPPIFVYTVFGMVSMLQLAGAGLITAGALLPRREVEVASHRVTLLPLLSPSALGVVAVGTL